MSRKNLMHAGLAAAGLVLVCAAGVFGQVRVSGLEHTPIGGATFGPPVERRLPVHNLGSSGEDGVEIQLNSRWGGAVSVDLDELLIPSPAEAEIRFRPKGWDGTVKSNLRLTSRPPDGTPGSSMSLECDFAAVSAVTVRVRVRDLSGVVTFDGVLAGPSVQCVVSMSPPVGIVPTCRLAIKTKGTNVQRVMSVDFGDVPCDVSGLASTTLHEVRSIEISPETCGACDTWLGTESLLVTGSGVSQCVVSDASVGTFGVSSHGLGAAEIDEECDDATDCDDVRRLHVANIGSSGQDGVSIDLRKGSIGASVTHRRGCCPSPGHTTLTVAFAEDGPETSRMMRAHDPVSGHQSLTCDATASGATEIDVHFHDASGAVLLSHREPTMVVVLNCAVGVGSEVSETWSNLHHRWRVDTSVPDTYTLPDGTSVAGVSSVSFVPRGSPVAVSSTSRLNIYGNEPTATLEISEVIDPPTVVRVDGIACATVGRMYMDVRDGFIDGRVPCCDDDDDGVEDGVELHYGSATGGAVRLSIAKLMENSSQNQRMRIRPKGWDGTFKGDLWLSGGGGGAGGSLHHECDFAAMGAVEIPYRLFDSSGDPVAVGTVSGASSEFEMHFNPASLPSELRTFYAHGTGGSFRKILDYGEAGDCVGLSTMPVSGVRYVELSPRACAACPPPWTNLESLEVTIAGMESLTLLGASLLTFGVEGNGIKDMQVGEVCDDATDCDDSRKIRVDNLGSSGQDGVALRLGNPLISEVTLPVLDGASFGVSVGSCCRGHETTLRAFDDEGQEAMAMSRGSDAGGMLHTMVFDASGSGATSVTVTLRDQLGNVVHSREYGDSSGSISYVGPCDASYSRATTVDSGGICMELCDSPVTVQIDFLDYPGVTDACWSLSAAPGSTHAVHGIDLTGNPTDYIEISGFVVNEGEPPCAADFNGDGTRDVPDIFAFLTAWFGGVPAAYNFGGTPGVPAIFAFLTAWFAGC